MSGVTTVKEEDTKPETNGGSEFINLNVKRQDGNVTRIWIRPSAKLETLMAAYCDKESVEVSFIAFLFDGRQICPEQTPNELEMEDVDEIDAMLHQTGDAIAQ